jgi:hypothetical protein
MIDPIISAIGGDSNKATDVRRALQVVVDFAQEFNCAVVGITHFSKGTSTFTGVYNPNNVPNPYAIETGNGTEDIKWLL